VCLYQVILTEQKSTTQNGREKNDVTFKKLVGIKQLKHVKMADRSRDQRCQNRVEGKIFFPGNSKKI